MLLLVEEVAERLRCSVSNVYSLIDKGELVVIPTGANGGRLCVHEDDLQAFLSSRRQARGKEAPRPARPRLKNF